MYIFFLVFGFLGVIYDIKYFCNLVEKRIISQFPLNEESNIFFVSQAGIYSIVILGGRYVNMNNVKLSLKISGLDSINKLIKKNGLICIDWKWGVEVYCFFHSKPSNVTIKLGDIKNIFVSEPKFMSKGLLRTNIAQDALEVVILEQINAYEKLVFIFVLFISSIIFVTGLSSFF